MAQNTYPDENNQPGGPGDNWRDVGQDPGDGQISHPDVRMAGDNGRGLMRRNMAESDSYYQRGSAVGPGGYNVDSPDAIVTNRGVGENELAGTRLNALMDPDSIMSKRAIQFGKDFSASRGLMNTSIGGGNAFGAWVDRAQPFALSEADRYGTTASENMAATNTAGLQDASNELQANLTEAQLDAARDSEERQHLYGASDDMRRAALNIENREDTQEFTTGEREGTEDFTTSEREGTQDFDYKLAQMDERIKMAGLAQQDRADYLSAWSLVETGKYNSIGAAGAAIYGNIKLKPHEMKAAVDNMIEFFQGIAPEIPSGFNPFADAAPEVPGGAPPETAGGYGGPAGADAGAGGDEGSMPAGSNQDLPPDMWTQSNTANQQILPFDQGGPPWMPKFNFDLGLMGGR